MTIKGGCRFLRLLIPAYFCLFFPPILYSVYPQTSELNIDKATSEADRIISPAEIEKKMPPPKKKPVEIELPSAPPAPKKVISVKSIYLTGVVSFKNEDFDFLVKKYENRDITLEELQDLAKDIEREYLKRGMVAAVVIPGQDVQDGKVTLRVIEAKMGRLEVEKHKYFNNERLRRYWRIKEGEVIRYEKISRSLQMMNKNADRESRARLRAGSVPETTDVILSTQTNFPAHFIGSFDNDGVSSTGRSRQSYGFRHNNLLGLDDTFIYGYNFGRDYDGQYAYHTLPLGYDGASLVYGFGKSYAKPSKEFSAFGLRSFSESYTVSLHQDFFSGQDYLGEASLGFDAKDKTVKQESGVYSRDRLRIFNIGANIYQRGFGSSTVYSPKYSQGVAAFGANKRNSPLASREAESTFSKFELGIRHRRILPLGLQGNFKFKGQVASHKLGSLEEYSLGGIDSVRGYPAGDYLADNAVNTNMEVLLPALFIPASWSLPYSDSSLRKQTTGLVFLDYGYGMRRGPSLSDKPSVNMFSAGAGLRFNLFNQAFLRLEWGFPLGANRPVSEVGNSRFHFSVEIQEKLPQEIERIRKMYAKDNNANHGIRTASQRKRAMDTTIKNLKKKFKRTKNPINQKAAQYAKKPQLKTAPDPDRNSEISKELNSLEKK